MSVSKTVTIVIRMQRATTQWGALSASVMLGSLEVELTVMVSSHHLNADCNLTSRTVVLD